MVTVLMAHRVGCWLWGLYKTKKRGNKYDVLTEAINLLERYYREVESRCFSKDYASAFKLGMVEAMVADIISGTLTREDIIRRLTQNKP